MHFSAIVLFPFFSSSVLGGGMCSMVICQHARMFIVHVLLLIPWVNFLKTLKGGTGG